MCQSEHAREHSGNVGPRSAWRVCLHTHYSKLRAYQVNNPQGRGDVSCPDFVLPLSAADWGVGIFQVNNRHPLSLTAIQPEKRCN